MDNFDIVYFIIISLITTTLVVMSFVLSARHNSKMRKGKKEKYNWVRSASKEIKEDELFIMSELMEGEIKCHKLPNSALPYNVGKWVNNMENFMEKPIFMQLLEMKGHDME